MSEMIERVAKAMAKADAENTAWKLYLREAKAAIEAMREPTQAMVDAGNYRTSVSATENTRSTWQAMIDAAHTHSP